MKSLWTMMIVVIIVIFMVFFYAYIYFPFKEAPILIEQVNKDDVGTKYEPQNIPIQNVTDAQDAVLFALSKNNPEELQKISDSNQGIQDENLLDNNLSQNDYVAILKSLWSEKDPQKRMRWLKKHEAENRPLLLFELAAELMTESPNPANFEESLYLLELAKSLAELDAVCIEDSSVKDAGQILYVAYGKAIGQMVTKDPELIRELSQSSATQMSINILKKLLASLKKFRDNPDLLASPDWLSTHSLKKLLSNKEFIDSKEVCAKKKAEQLNAFIGQIETELAKLS